MVFCLAEVIKEVTMQQEFNNLQLGALDAHLLEMVTEHLAAASA